MGDFVNAIGTAMQAGYALVKLRSAYAGPCIRIRRSSDNTEQDIGFNSSFELDWAAASAFIGGGSGFVVTWYDQSGNANNATQATQANQPSLDVVNERINFDGSNDQLVSSSNIGISGDAAFTTFVWGASSVGGNSGFLGSGTGSNSNACYIHAVNNTTVRLANWFNDYDVTTADLATKSLLTVRKSPGALNSTTSIFQNGAACSVSGSPGTGTPNFTNTTLKIGFTNFQLTGSLNAVIIVLSALGSTERAAGEDWLLNEGWLTLLPNITTTTLPNGVAGVGYDYTLAVTGGTGSITWTLVSGALPTGFASLPTDGSDTGQVCNTPGTYNFTVRATDSLGAYDEQALSITIVATPPIIGTDGEQYHKFAVEASVKEHDDSIRFATLRNDLQDGFRSQALVGINTGTRQFRLTLPTLTGGTLLPSVVGVNGETVSRERYLWGLYCEFQRTGKPFVIENFRNGQYYLVDFTNPELSYRRFQALFYSTGVELKQTRIDNVSIFQPTLIEKTWMFWDSDTAFATNNWNGVDEAGTTIAFVKTGDVIDVASGQNGHQIKRFNLTTNNGFIETGFGAMIYDVVIPVRFREPTFSNDADVFSNSPDGAYIKGDSGTTKFTDPSLANFFYSLNGTEYAADNMQAPMNEWGVCHFRNRDGWDVGDGMRIGLASGGAAPEMDIGDVFVSKELQPMEDMLELIEHLVIKFATG